ncbi:unnamed protein product [Rotaria sordida]|uniref:Uncharacterized protein n=1 Tax=Rotaria sordida TaxID=392033 RepID=A0A815ECJ8_9BILA|nr:unnamed protein product [Rotaria sordida]CAF1578930.1 unnamed protein product [Rotaria sordida]
MSDKKERCKIAKTTNNLSQAIGELIKASGVRQALVRQHKLMKPENTTTVLGADFNHININSKLTHIPDPHIPIPNDVVTVSKGITKIAEVMQIVNKLALPIAITLDGQTIKTGASIVGGWTGGIAGGMGGVEAGAAFGRSIGALFGDVGVIPGAAIGSIVGGILGSIGGGITGSYDAEALTGIAFFNDDEDSDEED